MECLSSVKEKLMRTKTRLQDKSFDSSLWLVNLIPGLVGFNIDRERIFIPFWILHSTILFYVYGVGNVVYQAKYAEVASDFIKSYINVSILALTANNSYWFLVKRQSLKSVLKKVKASDNLVIESGLFVDKHQRLLSMIKRILIIFYCFNFTTEFTMYLPSRLNLEVNKFAMTPCVGLRPLTSSPQREICKVILGYQELSICTVVLNYQTLLLLLIGHTAVMFQILSEELMTLNTLLQDPAKYELAKEKLRNIINRHALTLEVTKDLQSLYSVPLGINFGSNAVCMCFFFFLTLKECLDFTPVMGYCFLVFFLYCFLCQRLTNASEVFARAVYSCGWEMLDPKERRAIAIMLTQAQKPVILLAADLIPVNMDTFANTCQAIYKFTTVFKL